MADGLAEAADRDERQREEIQRLKRRLENLSEQLESESSARESARDPISRPAATQEPAEVDASRHALMDQILRANLELQKRIASLRPPAE
jgi:hypothetical protein